MASIHINKIISSFIKVGYTFRLSKIERGLQINLEGLGDENVIKHLLTVVMKSKFSSLTSIVFALYGILLQQKLQQKCRGSLQGRGNIVHLHYAWLSPVKYTRFRVISVYTALLCYQKTY